MVLVRFQHRGCCHRRRCGRIAIRLRPSESQSRRKRSITLRQETNRSGATDSRGALMSRTGRRTRMALAATAIMAPLVLSGCGFDDVQFNGAVFEAMGLANNGKSREEPKLPPRAGIVLPPDTEQLPEPGSVQVATPPPGEAWPVDPEERQVAAAEELDRQHQEFCREALWRARAAGQTDAQITGPKGSCNPSILRNLTGKDITTR